jgi:hypothetical protein
MIYFIQGADLVKIGYTHEPIEKKLREVQAFSPVELRLVALLDGGRLEEAELHKRFAKARRHSEWFILTDGVCEFVEEHAVRDGLVAEIYERDRTRRPPPRRLVLSDEERQRRSEQARRLCAEGKMGAAFGHLGGKPAG